FEAAFGALCEALSGAVPARLLRRWRLLGAQRKARTRAWLSARLEPAADRIRPTVQPLKLGPRRHAASSTDQGYRGARPGWQQRTPALRAQSALRPARPRPARPVLWGFSDSWLHANIRRADHADPVGQQRGARSRAVA